MDRVRLTITLKKNLIKSVDKAIDGVKIRNRSHAIEYLLSKILAPKISRAFILAGGYGVKMRPFTYEMPKGLIPVNNRPILEHIIDRLKEINIKDIIISIDYLGEKIKEYFGDGSKFGVKITYIENSKPSGTAYPLLAAKNILGKSPFLLIHGDVLANIDFVDMINFHESHKGIITMALTSVEDPSAYGAVKLSGSKIMEFREKIGRGPEVSRLINAGIYVVNPTFLDFIPQKKNSYLEKDVFPKLVKNKEIYGYVFAGSWFDVGTPTVYERALREWKS